MDQNKILHNTSSLNKNIVYLLTVFEKNKEWADISQWLGKVEQALQDYPSHLIKDRLQLAKRLAQCLSPLLPNAIHSTAINIYSLMLQNKKDVCGNNKQKYKELFNEDIGLFAVGLFPFYQNASFRCKEQFLKLIEDYFIPVGRDLIPCLPGLLLSLLPGLDDNNEKLLKQLNDVFDQIFKAVGRRYFIGSLWMAIMRQQRGRAQGIKLLQKIVPKSETCDMGNETDKEDDDEEEDEEEQQQQNLENNQDQNQNNNQENQEQNQNEEKISGQNDQDQQENQDENQQNQEQSIKPSQPSMQLKSKTSTQSQNNFSISQAEDEIPLEFQVIEQGIDDNNDSNNFPNIQTLVLNTLIQCIQDDNVLVKRTSLDFINTHLDKKKPLLQKSDKLLLVETLLYLFGKKDGSMLRRGNLWMFGKPDLDGKYVVREDNKEIIELLIDAFKNIFNNTIPVCQVTAVQPLKILQNFYMEHEDLVEFTLKDISNEIIQYIYMYSEGYDFSQEIKKIGRRFLQSIPKHIELFLNSLSEEVVKKIKLQDDEQCLKVVNLIKFTFENLLNLDNFEGSTAKGSLQHTISGIFKSLATLQGQDIDTFQFIQPALILVQQLVDKMEIIDNQINQVNNTKQYLEQQNNNKNNNQDQLSQKSQKFQQQQQQQLINEKTQELPQIKQTKTEYIQQNSKDFSQGNINADPFDFAIQDFQTFYENLSKTLSENSNKSKIKMMKTGSIILVRIQKFLSNKKVATLPNWFKCITKSIKMKNPRISLVAIEAMIEILISEKKDIIYETLKNLILEETQAKQKTDTLISGSDYTKVTLEKLWSLLDFQYYHDQIIDLILNFSRYFPQFFKEVVVNSFSIMNIAEQESAIRRFASFWKLTQQNYQSKQQLLELNKVGLFLMLDFLDHDNPLLRNASKNWLIEGGQQLFRIIDPLFEVLIQPNSNFYETDQGQLIYTKMYETKITSDTFRKFKSILVNASDMFSKYISNKELTKNMAELATSFTTIQDSFLFRNTPQNSTTSEKVLNETNINVSNSPKKMTYLDLLVLVCLKYIQGQALESMSIKFHIENAAVNASSCEFLEYLLQYFEEPSLSMKLCQYILDPLLRVFNNSIINKEYVMQISILNLFKTIFFRSAFTNKITDSVQRQLIFTPILSSSMFIPNILRGLNTHISYIKQQFVNFISMCLPIICQNLHHPVLTNQIKSILYSYFSLIQQYSKNLTRDQGISKEIRKKDDQQQQQLSNIQQINQDQDLQLQQQQIQQQQMESSIKQSSTQNNSENDVVMLVEDNDDDQQNSYEISILLNGVSEILQFFLKIQNVNKDESIMNLHNKAGSSVMGSFASVISLGLISKNEQRDKIEYQFDKYKETCQCILFDIQKVIEMFILSWTVSQNFYKMSSDFTKIGAPLYSFQQFNAFNTHLAKQVDQLNSAKQKGRVKNIIITSFTSLFYQYPQMIINTILKLWNRECATEISNFGNPFPKTAFLGNLIEILILVNPSTEFMLEALLQSDYLYRICQNYAKKHPKEKKNIFVLNIENALEEARIIYFIYVYFSYTLIEGSALKKENLLPFWMQILKILKIFALSKNPSTSLWILEILYMLSKKYSPKEILHESAFKKQLHELISEKLMFLGNVAAQTYSFIFNTDPKDFQQKKDPKNPITQQTVTLSKYSIILPLTPTQYELGLQYQQHLQLKQNKLSKLNQMLFNLHMQKYKNPLLDEEEQSQLQTFIQIYISMFENFQTNDEDEIYKKYKIYILKTIKNIGLDLLQNTYAPEKSDRIVTRTKEFMEPLFQVIEDKAEKNYLFLESCSEVLFNLLERSPALLVKEFKKSILDIFNKDNFFSQSKSTLKYWKKIINKVVVGDTYSDIFSEYLQKVTLSGSFFSKESTQNNTRVKSFKRVCFIIFSGEQDQYTNKLKILLDKISEVIRNAETVHPSLLILILFCVRILILRLSNANLKDLFKQIWPMLITLLIQIYSVQAESSNPNQKQNQQMKNPNLLLAGLKLIEILSIAQFDEFYLHQWIFIFDYFGLQIEPQSNVQKLRENKKKSGNSNNNNNNNKNLTSNNEPKRDQMTPFFFQPYLSNCMPNQEYLRYVNESYLDEKQTQYKEKTRRIIMKQSKVEDENQLQYQAWQLCLYIISCNENRQKVEPKVIEDLIEDDFIQLDEHVLKI